MCGFKNWEIGDVKYVVEHWMLRDDERQREYDDNNFNKYVRRNDINWTANSREHLCPGCAVARGLSFDEGYHQNKNAPQWANTKKRAMDNLTDHGKDKQTKKSIPTDGIPSICQRVSLRLSCVPNMPSCLLLPHQNCPLFVAWNGVLVFVYAGFPPSLVKAKSIIQESEPNLKKENFGSKWPKTTLAAMFDHAPNLTLEELMKLKDICIQYAKEINTTSHDDETISIKNLSVVNYTCRSLEDLLSRQNITLDLKETDDCGNDPPCSTQQKDNVDCVVQEWDDLSTYLPKVNQPGSRMQSYRQPADGATCVAFLEGSFSDRLRQVLVKFRMAVDMEFPGRYCWLAEKSLHCTLLSLDTTKD